MKLKIVSIVGKPNTGKSSLFNTFVGRGKAIVYDKPGTTIDINREIVELDGVRFILQDTGGYMTEKSGFSEIPHRLTLRVKHLLEKAVEESSLILFTVEFNNVTFLDYELASLLRKYYDKVKLVVTKVDTVHQRIMVSDDVYKLGFKNIFFVSSKTKYGFDELVESVRMFILETSEGMFERDSRTEVKVAIVGRINVGKSTIMNELVGNERVMVDDKPGTTRDSVDDFVEKDNALVRLTDTAGFRRSIFKLEPIEKFGIERTENAIRNADVVIVVIDGKEGVTKQDKKVLRIVVENYKPFVIAVNKMDLVVGKDKLSDKVEMGRYHSAFVDFISRTFENVKGVPVILTSAKERYNIDLLLSQAFDVFRKSMKRISTGVVNRKLREVIPQFFSGEVSTKLRIYYITQVEVGPPTFVVFVNKREHFKKHFENFLKRKIVEIFDFGGVPIKIEVREKVRSKV
ncbi:MAG: ribosome biogenesis GTPase Der [Brevinematia bacterium]